MYFFPISKSCVTPAPFQDIDNENLELDAFDGEYGNGGFDELNPEEYFFDVQSDPGEEEPNGGE
jgi:hypothetical protein